MVQADTRVLIPGTSVLLLTAILVCGGMQPIAAQDAAEPLIHMGLACLQEEPLATQFAERLLARGKPVFYIGDLTKGISQGDMIRFKDKAVLIDADIWQTLKNTGILEKLKDIPVLTLTAKARTDVWESRSNQVSGSNENKGYTLGRELLKIFQDYFGKTPSRMQIAIRFHDGAMSIAAPEQLMNELNFVNVVRLQKSAGSVRFVSQPPGAGLFVSQPFSLTVWAIDGRDPSGLLQYTCQSLLPPGLQWNNAEHAISGTPAEAGTWPIACTVRNSRNEAATYLCTLVVRHNTPPRVQADIHDIVIAGTHWEYAPAIADAEHTLDEIQVKLFNNPSELTWDHSRQTMQWDVPATIEDTLVDFVFGAKDPLGAITKIPISFRVLSPGNALGAMKIDFRLPLDSLIQGHTYSWSDATWMKAEWQDRKVVLTSIEGDDSTRYERGDSTGEGRLVMRPMRPGIHTLAFTFYLDTARIVVHKICAVKPNTPPVFRSSLASCQFTVGQFAAYTPVVADEDADTIRIAVIGTDSAVSTLVGNCVILTTAKPGFYSLALVATDPFGNSARQRICWSVLPKPDRQPLSLAWYAQKTHRMNFDLGFESNGFRIGLYAPDIGKTLTHGFLGINTNESPFLYFGANPFPAAQTNLGNFLFLDGGISFRDFGPRMWGGGLMGRLQGNYRKNGTSPWRFRILGMARLKQALLMVDTVGIGKELNEYQIDDINEYVNHLSDVFAAYGQIDNPGFVVRFETLYRLPAGFWAGPSMWIEDDIKIARNDTLVRPDGEILIKYGNQGNLLMQFTGLCLAHAWRFGWLDYIQELHVGWPGNSFKPKVMWNFTVKAIRTRR
jgi:hypothetical protein